MMGVLSTSPFLNPFQFISFSVPTAKVCRNLPLVVCGRLPTLPQPDIRNSGAQHPVIKTHRDHRCVDYCDYACRRSQERSVTVWLKLFRMVPKDSMRLLEYVSIPFCPIRPAL